MTQYYNKDLSSKTFLERSHVTCADLIVFCRLHEYILLLDDVSKYTHNHVMRW